GSIYVADTIGAGAFGTVLRAVDTATGTVYALKCMASAPPGSRLAELQHTEAALHQRASGHPNVVTLHCALWHAGFRILVMDHCAGGDLHTALLQGCFSPDDAEAEERMRTVFAQLLVAVTHCHSRGVFHRDLKPENVLVSHDLSQVYLVDFGLATAASLTDEFSIGTPEYMPPEAFRPDFRLSCPAPEADIWALGIILYILLTARLPWFAPLSTDDAFARY
ncbi:kinase-like domain-containing protein, partial [Vararia minispora EC-137]